MGRRCLAGFLETAAALAAVALYLQLVEPQSWLRVQLDELHAATRELQEAFTAARCEAKVSALIDSLREG